MSWLENHTHSQELASLAESEAKLQNWPRALEYYKEAARLETVAFEEIAPNKVRTLGITAVSAASLWYKARDLNKAQLIAHKGLATGTLPAFAYEQLQDLLQLIWMEDARERSGIEFTEGEVLISVSGGDVVRGGAPLELILQKVDEVGRIFYRTTEWLLNRPFRRSGAPSPDIQEQFRPWLFQAPAGSYQFAVRVQKPLQMSLFPGSEPAVSEITEKFMEIIRTSIDDPEIALSKVVPDEQYRDIFLKLTRNLVPTGKTFNKLEIKPSPKMKSKPIVLVPEARTVIAHEIQKKQKQIWEEKGQKRISISGILRAVHLDRDWLQVDTIGEAPQDYKIIDIGDGIDDVVGPMVNHPVTVTVIRKPDGKFYFVDIQSEV